jgi:ribosomal protein L11 methyltransferase
MSSPKRIVAVSVTAPAQLEDDLSVVLWEADSLGCEMALRPGPHGLLETTAYFEERESLMDDLRKALAPLGLGAEPTSVPQVDWVAGFRERFRPFRVGSFWIAPPWHPSPAQPSERTVLIEPGGAFGTGTHESTQLCVSLLEEALPELEGCRVLDVGSGTGILSIVARHLGARTVVAVDNDAEAMRATIQHARLNDTEVLGLIGHTAEPVRAGSCDLLVANLMAPLLTASAASLGAATRRMLILAGLLSSECDAVLEAYPAFRRRKVAALGEWSALWLERSA